MGTQKGCFQLALFKEIINIIIWLPGFRQDFLSMYKSWPRVCFIFSEPLLLKWSWAPPRRPFFCLPYRTLKRPHFTCGSRHPPRMHSRAEKYGLHTFAVSTWSDDYGAVEVPGLFSLIFDLDLPGCIIHDLQGFITTLVIPEQRITRHHTLTHFLDA